LSYIIEEGALLVIEELANRAIIYWITNTNFITLKDSLFDKLYSIIVKGIMNCNSTTSKDPLFNELYAPIAKGAYNSNILLRYTLA